MENVICNNARRCRHIGRCGHREAHKYSKSVCHHSCLEIDDYTRQWYIFGKKYLCIEIQKIDN